MRARLNAAAIVALLVLGAPAGAVAPDEILADAAMETRARELSKLLRCVVCRNQNIDDSNSDIARTMRLILRERLIAGDTDDEVVTYFVVRYGDFVLLQPPLSPASFLLWVGPGIVLILALGGFSLLWRRSAAAIGEDEEFTLEDRRLVESALRDEGPP